MLYQTCQEELACIRVAVRTYLPAAIIVRNAESSRALLPSKVVPPAEPWIYDVGTSCFRYTRRKRKAGWTIGEESFGEGEGPIRDVTAEIC